MAVLGLWVWYTRHATLGLRVGTSTWVVGLEHQACYTWVESWCIRPGCTWVGASGLAVLGLVHQAWLAVLGLVYQAWLAVLGLVHQAWLAVLGLVHQAWLYLGALNVVPLWWLDL